LSPNHVLVLVNGKRRHETANINVSGGLQSGATGGDLDTIPLAAIERIEVLRDPPEQPLFIGIQPVQHGGHADQLEAFRQRPQVEQVALQQT
ncbi:TonB-dependent receptor plug domain-containing protein, partial [Pseudomonas aeruginosa]